MSGPGEPSKATQLPWGDLGQSWAAPLGMWSAWGEAWGSLLSHRGAPAAKTLFERLTTPESWTNFTELFDELRVLLGLPVFADLPVPEPGKLPSPAPFFELAAVAQQYFLAVAAIWPRLFQLFQEEIEERRQRGEAMDSAGRAMDVWNNVLDRTLMEFNRSVDFATLQRRFLQAAMRQRREVRNMVEQVAESFDLPTRTEMDDAYRRIHDLTREVDALRRELRSRRKSASAQPPQASGKGGADGE